MFIVVVKGANIITSLDHGSVSSHFLFFILSWVFSIFVFGLGFVRGLEKVFKHLSR